MAITAGLPVGAAAAGGGEAGVLAGLGLLVERLRAGGHRRGTRDLFSLLVSLSRFAGVLVCNLIECSEKYCVFFRGAEGGSVVVVDDFEDLENQV